MSSHLKPDLEITKRIIDRDYLITFVVIISIIVVSIYALYSDWDYKPVFVIMGIVSFVFLGNKKDFPDDSWSAQQKGAWTKRYTTLKLRNDELIYISGDSPNDRETFALEGLQSISINKNKIVLELKGASDRSISTKYWAADAVRDFVSLVESRITKS